MKKTAKLFLSVAFLTMCFSCSTSNPTSSNKESSLSQNTENNNTSDVNTSSATTSNASTSTVTTSNTSTSDVTTSSTSSATGKYEDCTGTLARFPQEELNAFYGYQELIPSYVSDSYSYEGYYYAEGGYHAFDITSVVSSTASAAAYKSICEQAGLTVNDQYFSTYGMYITQSANAVYQLQFGEAEGLFFIEIFDNAEDSGSGSDVQVNQTTVFPQAQLDAYMGFVETVPSYEASLYNYIETVDNQGYKVFEIFSETSSTVSASAYKTLCEQAGLTVDDSFFATYNVYVVYSANKKYYIEFYEENGVFYLDIYDDSASSGGSGSDVQTNQTTVFPQAQLDAYMGFVEAVPSYEASLYNYVETVDTQNSKVFQIYSEISSTVSASAYKTLCEQAGLTVDDSFFATYGAYFTYSANKKYYIEFYEENGAFHLDIYDDTAVPSETVPTGEGETATFPQEMIDSFFESTEVVPSFEASSYEYFYGADDYGDALFEVASLVTETASMTAYKTICETNGLTVYDDYYTSDGLYITFSSNGLYQIQFYEDSGYFVVDIYKI